MRTTRDFFREQAERSRKLAARAEDAEVRAHLISVAFSVSLMLRSFANRPWALSACHGGMRSRAC